MNCMDGGGRVPIIQAQTPIRLIKIKLKYWYLYIVYVVFLFIK